MLSWSKGPSVVVLAALCGPTVAFAETKILKHDDGSQESKRSMTGSGHAIRFECPDTEKWYVDAISIHGSRYGASKPPNEDFQIVIASDDLAQRRETTQPYSRFERGKEKWVRLDIDPVEVAGAFYVAAFFNPTRSKGVYVGVDGDSAPTHSAILLASDPGKKQSDLSGDWMIRAHLTKEPQGDSLSLLDADARGAEQTQSESARERVILGNTRSITLKQDDGTMDDQLNIRGGLYTLQFETPKDVVGYVWQVQIYGSQFGGRHNSEEVSGDVYILDANRQVVSRTTFPYSLATQRKQWISIATLPTKVQGKFFVSIDTHATRHKGIYMGFDEGNPKGLASTDELLNDRVEPGEWSERFDKMQWMIRAKIADRPVVY